MSAASESLVTVRGRGPGPVGKPAARLSCDWPLIGALLELRIRVDLELCRGHRVRVDEAREIFPIERVDGTHQVILGCETAGPEQCRKLELAVRHCPTHALRLQEN